MSDELRKGFGIATSAGRDRAEEERRERERAARVERASGDPIHFAQYYFGHYFTTPPADWQLETLKDFLEEGNQAVAAPRGHGKTTFLAFLLSLWVLLTGRKRFGVYIGPIFQSACLRIAEIRMELEENERLLEDFGIDRVAADGTRTRTLLGETKRQEDLVLANGSRITAKGAGQSMRGVKHGAQRPDFVIVDDCDKDDQARSTERTDRLVGWLKRVVMPLAGGAGMKLLVIGNIIGRHTLLTWCLASKRFRAKEYQAIMDFETIQARPLMPALWPMERLLSMMEDMGRDAFMTEFQNRPPDEASRPFREDWFRRRWTEERLALADPTVWICLDPSKGKTASADFQALVAIQRDWKNGDTFILKADLGRRPPIHLMERMIVFCQAIGLNRIGAIGVEAVQFQEFLADVFSQVCAARGVTLRVIKIQQHLAKFDRITRLVPHAEGGRIWFPPEDQCDESMKLLLDQLVGFPSAKHDDGPDALEMAVDMSNAQHLGSGATVAEVSPWDRVYGT